MVLVFGGGCLAGVRALRATFNSRDVDMVVCCECCAAVIAMRC